MRAELKWLTVRDGKLTTEDGEPIRLHGIGLGNWFVHEGYMFGFRAPWDNPRNIRKLVALLAGEAYAKRFWPQFLDRYVTEADIQAIKADGYDSVRLPLDYALLMEDDVTETVFKEDGFRRIDRCIELCKKHGLYVVLDLHCAPGGQTGANIDNSYDHVPRLFLDRPRQRQCIALWQKLAARYRDEPTVAMYDLLNEPIATKQRPEQFYDASLRGTLIEFTRELVAAVRAVDSRHLLSIEGAHWSTDTTSFPASYDPLMVVHFHMYGDLPGQELFDRWHAVGRRVRAPIFLGETGENEPEWISAVIWEAEQHDCSTSLWCWKKVPPHGSPVIIRPSEGWKKIQDWTKGGPAPEPEEAQAVFDEFLEAIRIENCDRNNAVRQGVRREAPFALRAPDFDAGAEGSHAEHPQTNIWNYRCEKGVLIETEKGVSYQRGPGMRSDRSVFRLVLTEGDWVCYTAKQVFAGGRAVVTGTGMPGTRLELTAGEGSVTAELGAASTDIVLPLTVDGPARLRVRCLSGRAALTMVSFDTPPE